MLSWWWENENDARQVLSCAYDCQIAETSDSDRMISLAGGGKMTRGTVFASKVPKPVLLNANFSL
jgi:hypothetical protein